MMNERTNTPTIPINAQITPLLRASLVNENKRIIEIISFYEIDFCNLILSKPLTDFQSFVNHQFMTSRNSLRSQAYECNLEPPVCIH